MNIHITWLTQVRTGPKKKIAARARISAWGLGTRLPFPLRFCILQAIKNWMVGRPRNKANEYHSCAKKGPVSNVRPPPIIASILCKGLKLTPKSAHPIDLMRKDLECNMTDARLVYSYTENDVI